MIHVFDPGEAGQIRGLSNFHAAMVKMFHLDLYDRSPSLERKKQAARHAAVITNTGETSEISQTAELPPIGAYGPGAYLQLQPGEDIKFTEPSEVGGSYRTVPIPHAAGGRDRRLAFPTASCRIDLTKANYSSSRAGLVAFRLEVEAFQKSVLIFQLLRRVYAEWMSAAVLAGAVPLSASEYMSNLALFNRANFIPPKLPWVDPSKDARAEEIMVNNGYKSRDDVIESLGEDPEEVDLRIKIGNDRAELLKIGPFPMAIRSATGGWKSTATPSPDEAPGTGNPPQGDDRGWATGRGAGRCCVISPTSSAACTTPRWRSHRPDWIRC